MKRSLALICAAAAMLACAGSASAQDAIGDDSTWKFRGPSETVVLQNNLREIQLVEAGYYDALKNGGLAGGAAGAGGGLLGAGASTTANYYQIINQTTNNCSSSGGVGSPVTCGGGSVQSNGNGQTTSGSTLTSDTTITGNTVTSQGNKTQVGDRITNQ